MPWHKLFPYDILHTFFWDSKKSPTDTRIAVYPCDHLPPHIHIWIPVDNKRDGRYLYPSLEPYKNEPPLSNKKRKKVETVIEKYKDKIESIIARQSWRSNKVIQLVNFSPFFASKHPKPLLLRGFGFIVWYVPLTASLTPLWEFYTSLLSMPWFL